MYSCIFFFTSRTNTIFFLNSIRYFHKKFITELKKTCQNTDYYKSYNMITIFTKERLVSGLDANDYWLWISFLLSG